MIPYIFVIFAPLIGAFNQRKAGRLLVSFSLFIICWFILGLRAPSVGVDTESYYRIFHLVNNVPESFYVSQNLEPFFVFSNKLFGMFGFEVEWFIFFVAFFIILSITVFLHKYSPLLVLSWISFLGYGHYFSMHNVMRQWIAVAIVLFALPLIFKRKLLFFSVAVGVAMGFHLSAVVCLPIYFLYGRNFNSLLVFLLWCVSLIFVLQPGLIFKILELSSNFVPSAYAKYLSDSRLESFGGIGLGGRVLFLQVIFLGLLVFYSKIRNAGLSFFEGDQCRFLVVMGLFSILIFNVFSNIGLVSRVILYVTAFFPVSVPFVVFLFKGWGRVIVSYLLGALFILLYIRGILTNSNGVFPYETFIGYG